MFVESIEIFLNLLTQIEALQIETEVYASEPIRDPKKHSLSFNDIFNEICDSLRAHSRQKIEEKEEIWFKALRVLFTIRKNVNKNVGEKKTIKLVEGFINNKISQLMQIMTEYIDFENVIEVLLGIDKNILYSSAKDWFQGLYIAKNDQELLYSSAKRLLSNENSSLIDVIIERNNIGFIGERDKQFCALCNIALGGFVNDCAFILTQCEHKFHSKCFFEEIKNRRIMEGRKDSDIKPECPICKKHHVDFDSMKKRPIVTGRKRRGRRNKRTDSSTQDEETIEESEDDMSNHPLMEKKQPIRTMEQYEREYKTMDDEVYKQKLRAFDEDYAASQLNFMLD